MVDSTRHLRTTWHDLIVRAKVKAGDKSRRVGTTLSHDELYSQFTNNRSGPHGKPFTYWTIERVYFPLQYDGAEWVGSAPRNPCDTACEHQGG